MFEKLSQERESIILEVVLYIGLSGLSEGTQCRLLELISRLQDIAAQMEAEADGFNHQEEART